MNRSALFSLVALTASGAFFLSSVRLSSQEVLPTPKSPTELLNALKASNAELLQKQQNTLEKLEGLKKEAEQLRIMAKRS